MRKLTVSGILRELSAPGASVLELLGSCRGDEHKRLWEKTPLLYRAFGRRLIQAGHPTRAFDLIREGRRRHEGDAELQYLAALALARGGNVSMASGCTYDLLQRSDLDPPLKVEALSLIGRLNKDLYARAKSPRLRARFARESADFYGKAYRLSGGFFPGINAATMSLLMGRRRKARSIAADLVRQLKAQLSSSRETRDYWLLATLGEAHIILGDQDGAASWYREAVTCTAGNVGDLASARRQAMLLRDKTEVSEEVLALLSRGRLVAFAGHMIDHPSRQARKLPTRFPPDPRLERSVSRAIRKELDSLNAGVGYCSAACGSDILFAEQMLKRDAELHIVLPFDRGDFYHTSVDFGLPEMARWRKRCDRVLAQATEVHFGTTEPFLGDDVLFEFTNTFTQGLAITRARELGVEPCALVVLDPSSSKRIGGTRYFKERWTSSGREARVIDLAALRANAPVKARGLTRGPSRPNAKVAKGKIKRQLKAMLFADVKNFSKLREEQAPSFFATFLDLVAEVIRRSKHPPVFRNTWGDGLYLVFDHVTDCADFAMRLLDRFEERDFTEMGLPQDTAVRVGLHAGPVYAARNKIIKRTGFFGSHVTRAARIEPVTTPGCAFASEQFAAALAVEPGHDFVCEYIGVEQLAKEYDRCPLYRLTHT